MLFSKTRPCVLLNAGFVFQNQRVLKKSRLSWCCHPCQRLVTGIFVVFSGKTHPCVFFNAGFVFQNQLRDILSRPLISTTVLISAGHSLLAPSLAPIGARILGNGFVIPAREGGIFSYDRLSGQARQ